VSAARSCTRALSSLSRHAFRAPAHFESPPAKTKSPDAQRSGIRGGPGRKFDATTLPAQFAQWMIQRVHDRHATIERAAERLRDKCAAHIPTVHRHKVLMSPRLPSITLALSMAIAVMYPPAATAEDASDPVFEAGQEWSIESGSGAKIVIGRVEDWRNEKAIHVSIVDIQVPPGLPRAGTMTQIAHAPFAYTALQGSVSKLLRTNVPLQATSKPATSNGKMSMVASLRSARRKRSR